MIVYPTNTVFMYHVDGNASLRGNRSIEYVACIVNPGDVMRNIKKYMTKKFVYSRRVNVERSGDKWIFTYGEEKCFFYIKDIRKVE